MSEPDDQDHEVYFGGRPSNSFGEAEWFALFS